MFQAEDRLESLLNHLQFWKLIKPQEIANSIRWQRMSILSAQSDETCLIFRIAKI